MIGLVLATDSIGSSVAQCVPAVACMHPVIRARQCKATAPEDRQLYFFTHKKMSCLKWDSNPQHTVLHGMLCSQLSY